MAPTTESINTTETPILEAALDYHSRGFCTIPIRPRSKKPACRWKRFQDRRLTEGELQEWFGGDRKYGLAVVLGEASGGLVCRDFDDLDAYAGWATDRPRLAETLPTVETHRGRHVYCRTNLSRIVTLDDGELRGAGYCVLPPSEHPSGQRYRWVIPLSSNVPKLSLDELQWTPVTQKESHGSPHVTQRKTDPTPPCNTVWLVLHGSDANASVLQAIQRTLPDGQGMRERRLFALARELRGIPELADASPAELEPIVREWHRQALPVIGTKGWAETWSAFRRACGSVIHPVGCGRIDQIYQSATLDTDEEPLAALCRELQRSSGTQPFFLDCRTAGRLLGTTHVTAWRMLRELCASGVIELVQPGSRSTRQASTYRFLSTDDK